MSTDQSTCQCSASTTGILGGSAYTIDSAVVDGYRRRRLQGGIETQCYQSDKDQKHISFHFNSLLLVVCCKSSLNCEFCAVCGVDVPRQQTPATKDFQLC